MLFPVVATGPPLRRPAGTDLRLADQAKLDMAKAARDKKKAQVAMNQTSNKKANAYVDTVAYNEVLAPATVEDSDYSECHVCLNGQQFAPPLTPQVAPTAVLIKNLCLIRLAPYLIVAHK